MTQQDRAHKRDPRYENQGRYAPLNAVDPSVERIESALDFLLEAVQAAIDAVKAVAYLSVRPLQARDPSLKRLRAHHPEYTVRTRRSESVSL